MIFILTKNQNGFVSSLCAALITINRRIYMVVLVSAVEGSFDVKRAQCNWTKTKTLQLCVYMRFRKTGCSVLLTLG